MISKLVFIKNWLKPYFHRSFLFLYTYIKEKKKHIHTYIYIHTYILKYRTPYTIMKKNPFKKIIATNLHTQQRRN